MTLPFKLLYDFVNNLPNDTISMSLDERTNKTTLECRKTRYTLSGIDADEFPTRPTLGHPTCIEIGSLVPETLFDLVASVVYAAADEHTNPLLQGVHIQRNTSGWRFEAIDGYRMAIKDHCEEGDLFFKPGIEDTDDLIISRMALAELPKLFDAQDELLIISRDDDHAHIRTPNHEVVLSVRLSDGRFPDVQRFIPPSHTSAPMVETALLIKALKRAALVSVTAGRIVTVAVKDNQLSVTAEASEVASASEILDLKADEPAQPDAIVALNVAYFQDMINTVTDEYVKLQIGGPNSPVVVNTKEHLQLIMPMRLLS